MYHFLICIIVCFLSEIMNFFGHEEEDEGTANSPHFNVINPYRWTFEQKKFNFGMKKKLILEDLIFAPFSFLSPVIYKLFQRKITLEIRSCKL